MNTKVFIGKHYQELIAITIAVAIAYFILPAAMAGISQPTVIHQPPQWDWWNLALIILIPVIAFIITLLPHPEPGNI